MCCDGGVRATAGGAAVVPDQPAQGRGVHRPRRHLGRGDRLARKDPDGERTDGIVRVPTDRRWFGPGDAVKRAGRGGSTAWPTDAYLNIWGDTLDCSGGDRVPDTPNCAGPNFGKPTVPVVTCSNGPNGDMFMNYMDYVDDGAMFMFTAGQVSRMSACLAGPRKSFVGA